LETSELKPHTKEFAHCCVKIAVSLYISGLGNPIQGELICKDQQSTFYCI